MTSFMFLGLPKNELQCLKKDTFTDIFFWGFKMKTKWAHKEIEQFHIHSPRKKQSKHWITSKQGDPIV